MKNILLKITKIFLALLVIFSTISSIGYLPPNPTDNIITIMADDGNWLIETR